MKKFISKKIVNAVAVLGIALSLTIVPFTSVFSIQVSAAEEGTTDPNGASAADTIDPDSISEADSSEKSLGEQLFDEYGQPIIDDVTEAAKEAAKEAVDEAKEEAKASFWQAVKEFFLEIKKMIQEWLDSLFS